MTSGPCDCKEIAKNLRDIKRLVLAQSIIGPAYRFPALLSVSAMLTALAALAVSVVR